MRFVWFLYYLCTEMRKILLFVCSTLVVVSACRNANKSNELLHHQFKTDVMLKATPVKNQGSSSLCWAYAMLGTIESERLMMGDSVNLSVDYLARMLLKEQARETFFAGGRKQVSLRGTASMALRLLERYGMLHEDTYHSQQVNYNVLARKVQLAASRSASLQKMMGLWMKCWTLKLVSCRGLSFSGMLNIRQNSLPTAFVCLMNISH